MNYSDAIVYLKEHNIKKEDGTFYEFGEVHSFVQLDLQSVYVIYDQYLRIWNERSIPPRNYQHLYVMLKNFSERQKLIDK